MANWLRTLLSSLIVIALLAIPRDAGAADEFRITGPVTHRNLSVYFVHGGSAAGPVPLTLQEALARGTVVVTETGSVNELTIENKGEDEVFVQSGSIVKGGQQDRVLTVSLALPAHSGRIPLAVFCVEHGRWSARGQEDVGSFASAKSLIPSYAAKMAMKAPPVAGSPTRNAGVGDRQQQIWNDVARMQDKLSANLGAAVAAPQSRSSLQLALENKELEKAQAEYLKELEAAGDSDPDIVGFAFAIDGKLNSAEVYPSNGLFRKMWRPLLSASATEALAKNRGERQAPPPAVDAVQLLLQSDEPAPATVSEIGGGERLVTRDGKDGVSFETRRSETGGWVQKSYLAK